MIDLNKLIELAEKATPGKWYADPFKYALTRGGELAEEKREENCNFIAAANPETIKRLCEVIKVYEEAFKSLRSVNEEHYIPGVIKAAEKVKSILEGG